MRPIAVVLAALLALAAVTVPATAAGKPGPAGKRAKRAADRCAKQPRCAKVRRQAPRTLARERLLDRTSPAPGGDPGQPTDPALPAPEAPPRFVSVAAREFSLTLSRPLVSSGDVRVELRNVGEDPHNLVVSPEGTHNPLATWPELDPGAYERRTVPLSPGRYLLWCSLEFHEAQGMSVTLRVG